MKKINVALKQNPYDIVIGRGILRQLGAKVKSLKIGCDAVIITNALIKRLYGKQIEQSFKKSGCSVKFFLVKDGEASKSAEVAFDLMEKIARYDVYKSIFIVALGGGVIGDLAGYVAAAYKRGVPYIQVPTTFLAQIDSSIGGKVAVDLPVGKNLVGAFYQPKVVFSDVAVLKSLSQRQLRNGMAEAIKYGIIDDAKLFSFIEKNMMRLLKGDLEKLDIVVKESSRIKAKVVMADEKETKDIRTILNFGHTVGHAIEAAGKFKLYQHGEAIGLGMRIAIRLSQKMKMLSEKELQRMNRMIDSAGLPKKIKSLKVKDILNLMKHDKKFVGGKNKFVLTDKVGHVKVLTNIPLTLITASVKEFIS